MKRADVRSVSALLIVMAWSVASASARTTTPSDGQTCSASATGVLEGSIAALDFESILFNVKVRGDDGTFDAVRINPSQAVAVQGGDSILAEDLQVGQRVTICRAANGGAVDIAESISVSPSDEYTPSSDGSS